MKIINALMLVLFGLMSFGSGLCTLGFTPMAMEAPALFLYLVPSGIFSIGCFFIARIFWRQLMAKKPNDDQQS